MLIWRDKASGLIHTCVNILFSSVRHSQPGQSHWITHSRRHNRLQSLKCASNIKNVFEDPYVLFHISTFLVLHHKSPFTLIFIKLHISPLFTASLLLRLYRSFDVFRKGQIWGSLTMLISRNCMFEQGASEKRSEQKETELVSKEFIDWLDTCNAVRKRWWSEHRVMAYLLRRRWLKFRPQSGQRCNWSHSISEYIFQRAGEGET